MSFSPHTHSCAHTCTNTDTHISLHTPTTPLPHEHQVVEWRLLTLFLLSLAAVQVVVVGTLAEDVGRMFGLDVRATDRDGDAAGRSAIANVFVS